MYRKITELLECPEWNQEKLAERLGVSIDAVKSWTRKNEKTRRKPNKWIMPTLEKIFDRVGIS